MPSDDSPPRRVAWALNEIEMFRAAGRREDSAAEAVSSGKISEATAQAIYDDSVEKQTEATIRGLLPRIAQIRHLITKVTERQHQRRQLVPLAPHVLERTEQNENAKLTALCADLDRVTLAVEKLHEDFEDFNPVATSHPLTLSGWRSLEREIGGSLNEVRVELPTPTCAISEASPHFAGKKLRKWRGLWCVIGTPRQHRAGCVA